MRGLVGGGGGGGRARKNGIVVQIMPAVGLTVVSVIISGSGSVLTLLHIVLGGGGVTICCN